MVKIFVLSLFKVMKYQSALALNRSMSSNFRVAEKCKPCEIHWRIFYVYEVCFSLNIFTNRLNMGLPQLAWVEKTIDGVETHWLSGREKVSNAKLSKEGHADRRLEHEINHDKWFPWKKNCFLLPTFQTIFP